MITKSAFFPSHCLRVFLPENSRFHSSNHGDINEITDTQCNGVKLLLKLRKVVIDGMAHKGLKSPKRFTNLPKITK